MSLRNILTAALAATALVVPASAGAAPAQDLRSPDTVSASAEITGTSGQDLRAPDSVDRRFVDVPVGSSGAVSSQGDSVDWPLVGFGGVTGLVLLSLAGTSLVRRRRAVMVR